MPTIRGTDLGDTLFGDDRIDIIYGYGGQDFLYGSDGRDSLYGGAGDDFLRTKGDSEVLYGGSGNDYVFVTEDYDLTIDLRKDGFQDIGFGTTGKVKLVSIDSISSGNSNDKLHGNDQRNFVSSASGNDTLYGYGGDDALYGGGDTDFVFGGSGDDEVDGAEGRDRLKGGSGDDTVFGGTGRDKIEGGLGEDRLYGGEGRTRDDFVFRSVEDSGEFFSRDQIWDFQKGIDKFDLFLIDANTNSNGNQAFTVSTSGRGEFMAPDVGARYSVWVDVDRDLEIVTVYADNNGDGAADLQVSVLGIDGFRASDIIL